MTHFIIGMFVGTALGILIAGLLVMARDSND